VVTVSDDISGVDGESTSGPGGVARFAGRWRRTGDDETAARYPEHVEFRADGVYLTPPDPIFREWQAGDYEIQTPGRLTMQTSNDAMVGYDYDFGAGGELIIHDTAGTEIVYIRDDSGETSPGRAGPT